MATLSLNALKTGDYIKLNNRPYLVVSTQHLHIGRGGAVLKIKIKDIVENNLLEKTFKGDEKIEEAEIKKRKAIFLYQKGENVFFMDGENYEEFNLPLSLLKEKIKFLKEGSEVKVIIFENKPITIELPKKVELKVISAPPGVRGDTAQGSVTKPVTLETGLKIQAPLFIKEGDIIRVNTEKEEYVERVQ